MLTISCNSKHIFSPWVEYKIRLLQNLSDFVPSYLEYPEEDKEVGSLMDLTNVMGDMNLEQSGRVYISGSDSDIEMVEGTHFEFVSNNKHKI